MENIRLENGKLYLLDQTQLPNREIYITPETKEDYFRAIQTLQVRGAPAIGIFAAYAMALLDGDKAEIKKYLDSARPTAVNLSWATQRMLSAYNEGRDLLKEALDIHNEDKLRCRRISEYGLSLLNDGDGILTHCNAGALATSQYGTGLGPLLLGKEKGYTFHAYVDETRPLLQGARLTSYELEKAEVDTTLICDNTAATLMKQGKINAVLVGADRIAANGDTANKIGTLNTAILAKHFNVPFYVLAPTSTIDYTLNSGEEIVIEERADNEIKTMWYKEPMAPGVTKCFNPAFDVTDAELITAIITEKGIIKNPDTEKMEKLK